MNIEIPFSKKKIVLLLIGAIVFVVAGVLFVLYPDFASDKVHPVFVSLTGVACIVFFGFGVVNAIKKLFDKKLGLIINEQGIVDNSSAVTIGLIQWKNITDVSITELFGQRFLTIEVNNAEEIISNLSGLKKIAVEANKKYFSSPIQISATALNYDIDTLFNDIKTGIATYKK